MDPLLKCFSYSLAVDGELLGAELQVNRAWVKMLAKAGLITSAELRRLLRGLQGVGKELKSDNPHESIDPKWIHHYEDIHTLIQARLEKKVGDVAKKIHTGRSRNELVITSTRIYLRQRVRQIESGIADFQRALVASAEKAGEGIIPGMTHLKKAQPVLLAHHLLAYVEMLEEDKARLQDLQKRINILPLGSGALAGSGLRLDQKFLAKELGFPKISTNSLTAVSDRGFICELLSGLSILWVHLSRLAEDFILWNSEPFHYVELDDAFATGSSLMPHKKNPDVFELTRARSGIIFGHLVSLLTLQKGLPLAYNRDLQEDKPALFDALRKTVLALAVLAPAVRTASWDRKAMAQAVEDEGLFATDLLEYLVKKNLPFRQAHETVGRLIRESIESQKPVREFSVQELKRFSRMFDSDVYDLLNAESSVASKKTIGSTHPAKVKQELNRWKRNLK